MGEPIQLEQFQESDAGVPRAKEGLQLLAPQLQEGKVDNRTPTQHMLGDLLKGNNFSQSSLLSYFGYLDTTYKSGLHIMQGKGAEGAGCTIQLNQKDADDWDEQFRISADGKTVIHEYKDFKDYDNRNRNDYQLRTSTGKVTYTGGMLVLKDTGGPDISIAPDGSFSESDGTRWMNTYSADGQLYTSTRWAKDGSIEEQEQVICNPGTRSRYRAEDGTYILFTPKSILLERASGWCSAARWEKT